MSGPRNPRPPAEWLAPIRLDARIAVDQVITLGDLAQKQLAFREVNVKEAFTVVDAEGTFFRASRKEPDRALVYERMTGSTESPARITLVCAVLARQRMLVVIQKATELGCVRIVPVWSDHSVKPADLDKEKPWAWPTQAIKGAKQCRRASVPEVLAMMPFAQAIDAPWWTRATARFSMDDRPEAGDPFEGLPRVGDYVLAVGPEGGWSDRERDALAKAGARTLALGARVLRAETAVFAGLSIVQHRLGDLRSL